MAKLLDTMGEPCAKAAIVWIVVEYCLVIPLCSMPADVLRKVARRYSQAAGCQLGCEDLSHPAKTELISLYGFNLARFSQTKFNQTMA